MVFAVLQHKNQENHYKTNGNGYEEWEDGRKYIGEFKNDKREGKGTATYVDGSTYVGEWKNGEHHGQGTYTFASGKVYSGEFKNGAIIKGIAKFPNGTKYEGEFEFGKPKEEEVAYETKEVHRIIVSSKKTTRTGWVKEKNKLTVEEKLKKIFTKKANKICSSNKNFEVIRQNIIVTDLKQMSKLLSNEKYNVYRLELNAEIICN